ncbi:hypothetical protein SAMN02745823_00632 [Sporobacter termitidis DSM 10068]|uniref:Uncharacterized protein n=1 Tax=Sporobacter termitidis DSM 10068 TaxID=1123282 RepID=A0A1M5URD4_9FIRM|nr:hypothetical protein [Sporobacter termitidis]SHH65273.1 hypothetical protein SAMN02745823_00632 [Sporobacter termitidis DSM 10068]
MFKKDYERTPQEKAQRAKLSVFARLGGCAYLIYILVQLLKTPPAEIPDSPWTVAIAVVLMVLAGVVIVITILELIRSLKAGLFNAEAYEEEANFPCNPPADAADDTTETDALEAHTEDEASGADDSGGDDGEDDEDDGDTKSE